MATAWFMRQRPAHGHGGFTCDGQEWIFINSYTPYIYTCQNPRCVRSCILIWNEERINWAYQISDSHLFSNSYRKIFQIWAGKHLPLASPIKWACDCDMQHSKRQRSTNAKKETYVCIIIIWSQGWSWIPSLCFYIFSRICTIRLDHS